jgi:uncharacterized protein (TIGR02145 family)
MLVVCFTTNSKAQGETDIISYSFAEQTTEAIITSNTFDIGLTEINTGTFLDLVGYTNGTHYLKRIGLNTSMNTSDVNNIEIRFGQGTQKAHRFTIPTGSGAGVAEGDYTYQDYIDVPFQVWDVDNDKQLMVSFRDQQNDGNFNLIERNTTAGDELNHSREYLFIHNVDYATTANSSIALGGGHMFDNLYFLWPYLTPGGAFDPSNLPTSNLAIEVANSKVEAKVVFGIDLLALIPTVTIDENSTVSPASGITNDFTEPRIYKVTAQDGVSFEKYLVSVTFDPNSVAAADSLSLLALYNSTDGANWTNKWDLAQPISTWNGVEIIEGRVTTLDLHLGNLRGTIPPSLSDLSELTGLYLHENQLTGSIPIELGNLTKLSVLNLAVNQLTGTIPPELGMLDNMTDLSLHQNVLTGEIPQELSNLTELRLLTLYINQLDGTIPVELGSLNNLIVLFLGDNQLSGSIPTSLGNLNNLTNLNIGNNNLTGEIPQELGGLINIKEFSLVSNQLTGPIPTEIWNLTNLNELRLESNDLSGSIPDEVANLSSLFGLTLYNNANLSGSIPNSITDLGLDDLRFSGTMICEPTNSAFQTWKSTVTIYQNSGIVCEITATDIEAFSVTGQTETSTPNTSTHTVDIEVVFGTDVTALVSTFTLSSGATAEVGATTQVSGTTANDIANPITYSITAEDGNTKQDWMVTVTIAPNNETDILSFKFSEENKVVDIDGNFYKAIPIGTQLWMADNLKATSFNNGESIPLVVNDSEWAALSTGGYSWFENNETDNKDTFGALYNWYSVETGELCPSGWQVPSDDDWSTLASFLGGNTIAGGKMKATGTEFWNAPNTAATNESGFNGLPGSNRVGNGIFSPRGHDGDWWTSTEKDAATAYPRNLQANTGVLDVEVNGTPKDFGYSVRCIQSPTNSQVNLVVPYGTDITSLVPTINLSTNASIDPGIGVAQDFTNPVTYMVTAEDGETTQNWTVTVTIAPNTATDFTAFSFTEETAGAIIDDTAHTLDIEVAYGTDVTVIVSSYTLSARATAEVETTAQVSGTTGNDFTNPVTYTVTAEDATTIQDWVVTVTIAPSNETDILDFSLSEQRGDASIDATSHTIDIEVAYETSLAALIPIITLSDGASVNPEDQVAQDFTNPVAYTVTAEDATTIQDWVVTVTIAPSTETDIIGFSLSEQTGDVSIDATSHTIDIEVAYETSLAALIPIITLSDGASVNPEDQVAQDFTNPVAYTVTAEDGATTQDWIVTVTIAPSNETDILGFSIPEQTGEASIDATNHTIDIEVAYETSLVALIPTITLSDGASVNPEGQVAQDFTNAITYTVMAEDRATTQDWIVTVTIAPSTETDILGFSISEQTAEASIDPVNYTIGIEVINKTNLASLAPSFELSDGATVKVGSVDQISGTTINDFGNVVNYIVTAEDGVTEQVWVITVSEEFILGVENSNSIISIFPNPVSEYLTIEFAAFPQTSVSVSITSLSGKVVKRDNVKDTDRIVIDVKNYERGIYIVLIEHGERKQLFRFVKE